MTKDYVDDYRGFPPGTWTLNAGDGAVLGALFEPELIQRIGNAFNAGGGAHFIDQGLPQPIADYLNARWQEGYRVMVTQIRTDISAFIFCQH